MGFYTGQPCTAISLDLAMMEQWIPINCSRTNRFTGAVCELMPNMTSSFSGKMPLVINDAVAMCPGDYVSLDGYCVVIQPLNIHGTKCLLQGKPCVLIPTSYFSADFLIYLS